MLGHDHGIGQLYMQDKSLEFKLHVNVIAYSFCVSKEFLQTGLLLGKSKWCILCQWHYIHAPDSHRSLRQLTMAGPFFINMHQF